ncbi:aromatic amino acid ammonia-lyase [Intrasporangium mesophilum]
MTITLTGRSLTVEAIESLGAGTSFDVDASAAYTVGQGAEAARQAARLRPVYGRTSGVGANRDQATTSANPGRALLRSHAAGFGDTFPAATVRSALVVRVNQLLSGASGATPALLGALVGATRGTDAELPVVHRRGSVGTGDLTALAEVGLTLLGERPRADGTVSPAVDFDEADALPLMSSSAFTLAEAALGCLEIRRLADVATRVCALSFVALRGNPEAFGPAVQRVTPFPGAVAVAATVRGLVEPQAGDPAQLQDFFGLRTFPQVHGPLVDRLNDLRDVVETLVNAGSENPAVVGHNPPEVAHHGGFHQAYLALAVDSALLALVGSAHTCASRLAHLLTDPATGLPRFLAGPEAGSSGLLILEYDAASAMALLRDAAAAPRSVQWATVSAGVEDGASHASAAAARLGDAAGAYRQLIALELVTAVRALRMTGQPVIGELADLVQRCWDLAGEPDDHDLAPAVEAAGRIVDQLAAEATHHGA